MQYFLLCGCYVLFFVKKKKKVFSIFRLSFFFSPVTNYQNYFVNLEYWVKNFLIIWRVSLKNAKIITCLQLKAQSFVYHIKRILDRFLLNWSFAWFSYLQSCIMSVWLHIWTESVNVFWGQQHVTRSYLCRHPTCWIMITFDLIITSRNSSNVLTEIMKTLIQQFVGYSLHRQMVFSSTDFLFCFKLHIQWLFKIFWTSVYKKKKHGSICPVRFYCAEYSF